MDILYAVLYITCFYFCLCSAPTAEYNLPRRTPPLKPKASTAETTYKTLPKSPIPTGSSSPPGTCSLPSDYKYAHDRLSHFRMSTDERMATKEGMVWQLYEWQQRQQFRHGSPTAPIYTGPNFTDSASFRVTMEMPRSISVPPSPCEVPPSVPCSFKPLSPRRPHTPSERRSVKPLDEMVLGESTRSSSPSHVCAQITQVRHWCQVLPHKTFQKKKKKKPITSYDFQLSWVL